MTTVAVQRQAQRRRSPLAGYLLRRAGTSLLLLVGVTIVTFALTNLVPGDPVSAALGEGPAFPALPVERHVQRAVVQGIADAAPAGQRVVGREDAADKADQRDSVAAVVAQRVDVPPSVAVVRDRPVEARPVEARSASRLAAAIRPESAAIGMPAPGCVLPPAR